MTPDQARALTSLAVFAALADGQKSDAERAKLKEVVEGLGTPSATEALRRVLLKQTTISAEAALLDSEELRLLAWEAALGVCEADGETSPAEREFLDSLARSLNRPADLARQDVANADAMSRAASTGGAFALPALAQTTAPAPATTTDPRAAEVDSSVLRNAILTSAVELLPQNLATLAIIPLQTRMVANIGRTYGYPLSASSIKEFIATIGVGMTGQVVEQYARKILGKLGGSLLGSLGKTAANWGTGPALTFATTYAMGMVAKQYYAGGRTLSAVDLRTLFTNQVESAKTLYQRYEPQIRQTAATTDPRQLLASLRSGA